MDRAILHSDMNCFYASVEMLHHPEYAGRPLAVGGDPEARHGIVLTANYPAKKRGVKTGMALWQARQACPDVIFVPPRMDLYLRFSRLAQQIYAEYTDLREPFGIDESWLDVTACTSAIGDAGFIASQIRERMKKELGLTVSIGVSWNKIFAKFGSDYRKPDAVTEITRENYRDIIWRAPASDLLYVGRATARKLWTLGLHTIGDVAACEPRILNAHLGKIGLILRTFANGEDQTPVAAEDFESPVKSIGNSTTTPRDLENDEDMRMVIGLLSESVASRLRDNHFAGRNIGISVRDNGLCWFSRQHKIEIPTNISDEIARYAMQIFLQNYDWKHPIRSVGVRVAELQPDAYCYQTSLFTDESVREKQLKMDKAVDLLRRRFGHDSVLRCRMYYDRVLAGLDAKAEAILTDRNSSAQSRTGSPELCPGADADDHMVHPHSYFENGVHVFEEPEIVRSRGASGLRQRPNAVD